VSAVPSGRSVAKNLFDWLKNASEETFVRWFEGGGRELDVEVDAFEVGVDCDGNSSWRVWRRRGRRGHEDKSAKSEDVLASSENIRWEPLAHPTCSCA
jgi:hypothetical protein